MNSYQFNSDFSDEGYEQSKPERWYNMIVGAALIGALLAFLYYAGSMLIA